MSKVILAIVLLVVVFFIGQWIYSYYTFKTANDMFSSNNMSEYCERDMVSAIDKIHQNSVCGE